MSDFNLTSFPPETLEEIFKNLEENDIINVTKTCSLFNEVVSTSNAVMKHITFYWRDDIDEDDHTMLMNSIRRYQKMRIQNIKKISSMLKDFLQINTNLTHLTLRDCTLKATEFQFIMEKVSKKIVELKTNLRIDNLKCETRPIHFPKLVKLYLQRKLGGDDIFNIFYGAKNITKLIYEIPHLALDRVALFWRVLGSMDSLTDLTLIHCDRIFAFNDLFEYKFQLESLQIFNKGGSLSTAHGKHNLLLQLIQKQCSSLKKLHMSCIKVTSDIFESILNMSSLEKLKLHETKIPNFPRRNYLFTRKNRSIEYFDYRTRYVTQSHDKLIRDFIKNCAGLRKFNFESITFSLETLSVLAQLRFLQTLNLELKASFVPLHMPNVKEMSLLCNEGDCDVVQMIRLNPQLEMVKIWDFMGDDVLFLEAIGLTDVEIRFIDYGYDEDYEHIDIYEDNNDIDENDDELQIEDDE